MWKRPFVWRSDQRIEMLERGYRNTGNFVMTNLRGQLLAPPSLTTSIRSITARAGAKISPHQMRHMHASDLLLGDVHPKVVQARLGHTSVATTLDIYSHLVEGAQDAATEAAGRALGRVLGASKD